jgi:hypothetical protein
MTDRLSSLLHDEATALHVPAVPADRILTQGRGLRRRRRATTAVAGAVAAVLVAAAATTAVGAWRDDDSIEPARPADLAAYQEKGAWAVGDEVHIGDRVVTLPDVVDALRYTSVGVLAWTQHVGADAASARSETRLITPDGEVHPVDLPGLEHYLFAVPATDVTTPYIAYDRPTDDQLQRQLVVADLATGDVSWVGDPRPVENALSLTRLVLSGDDLYYTGSDIRGAIDWRTGERHAWPPGAVTTTGIAGGAYVGTDLATGWTVWSTDGDKLLDVRPYEGGSDSQSPSLSPDGRWFAIPTGDSGIRVYSVATGDSVRLGGDRDVSDYGWTPDGHLLGKQYPHQDSEVELCDPETGSCEGTGVTLAHELTLVRGADGLPVTGGS